MHRLNSVTCDDEHRLYVLPCGGGYTCLGYDVCLEHIRKYAEWLGITPPDLHPGTLGTYVYYEAMLLKIRQRHDETGERCPVDLTPEFIGKEGYRVEVVDRYDDRRRFIIGKSTGHIPIHLEIPRRDSSGGCAVTGAPFKSIRFIEKVR